ncbi:MAG TPA: HTTM domain-containing protein [Polyangiales bacterium]|jgi:hypothetical protein
MDRSLATAISWSERTLALALLLQTIELLQIRAVLSDVGVWRWSILREEQRELSAPLRWTFGLLSPYPHFIALLWLRLAGSIALYFGIAAALPCLWLSQLAICLRFRGTFNGGSDSMTVVMLSGLCLSAFDRGGTIARAGLLYIAVQVTLSYLIAGVAKLKEADWRSGAALRSFILDESAGSPRWARAIAERASAARFAAWGVIAFECLFPLAWLDGSAAISFGALGLCFHLGNALVFGLNRFLFAWLAAYPALIWASDQFALR